MNPNRKRRASVMYSPNPGKQLGSFYGGDKVVASGGYRRSFRGSSNLMRMQKYSMNKKFKEKDDDENSLGTDYSDDDNKELEYRQRNKNLYKTLKKIGV